MLLLLVPKTVIDLMKTDLRSSPVSDVDVAVMEQESKIVSRVFRPYKPSSSSVNICCLDFIQLSIAPVHHAG